VANAPTTATSVAEVAGRQAMLTWPTSGSASLRPAVVVSGAGVETTGGSMRSTLTSTMSMPLSLIAVLIFSFMDAGVSLLRAVTTDVASTTVLAGMVMVYVTTALVPLSRRTCGTSEARRRLHSIQTRTSPAPISPPAASAMPLAREALTSGRAAKASQSGTVRSILPSTRLGAPVSAPALVVAVAVSSGVVVAVGSMAEGSVVLVAADAVAVVAVAVGAAEVLVAVVLVRFQGASGITVVSASSGPSVAVLVPDAVLVVDVGRAASTVVSVAVDVVTVSVAPAVVLVSVDVVAVFVAPAIVPVTVEVVTVSATADVVAVSVAAAAVVVVVHVSVIGGVAVLDKLVDVVNVAVALLESVFSPATSIM